MRAEPRSFVAEDIEVNIVITFGIGEELLFEIVMHHFCLLVLSLLELKVRSGNEAFVDEIGFLLVQFMALFFVQLLKINFAFILAENIMMLLAAWLELDTLPIFHDEHVTREMIQFILRWDLRSFVVTFIRVSKVWQWIVYETIAPGIWLDKLLGADEVELLAHHDQEGPVPVHIMLSEIGHHVKPLLIILCQFIDAPVTCNFERIWMICVIAFVT